MAELAVAALDHEARHEAMEHDAVVEAAVGERDEVAGGDRRQVGVDLIAMAPLSVVIVTVRVSPAGSAAGWLVGQPLPAAALADGALDAAADGAVAAAAPPPLAEQAARSSVARMDATAEPAVREREVMRQPPGQRGSRGWPDRSASPRMTPATPASRRRRMAVRSVAPPATRMSASRRG